MTSLGLSTHHTLHTRRQVSDAGCGTTVADIPGVLPRLFALTVLLVATLAASPAGAAIPWRPLDGVEREVRLEFPIARGSTRSHVRQLPGERTLQIDLTGDPAKIEQAARQIPDEFVLRLTPLEHGLRVRISHSSRPLSVQEPRRHPQGLHRLSFGALSEETRLRNLAERVRYPIPPPKNLGARLELWQEAEQATYEGRLEQAKRLWTKIAEERDLRDLAQCRMAELYVMSGHINEAKSRLREVARNNPRSSGAALARLTALNIDTIIGEGDPTYDQVMIAAAAGNRARYGAFAWLRATHVLSDLGAPDLALHHFPRIEQLPPRWQEAAKIERDRIVSASIGWPGSTSRPLDTAVRYAAWESLTSDHVERDSLRDLVADAYIQLGLYELAIPLLRDQLTRIPAAQEEARIVALLAIAYHGEEKSDHEREVLHFLVAKHPDVPGLHRSLKEFALSNLLDSGIDHARHQLAELRASANNKTTLRTLFSIEIELAQGWGTTAQQVQALEQMQKIGFDDPNIRSPALAIALAESGRYADAAPRLRAWISRTTDPERRDKMGYLLAQAEFSLKNDADGQRILDELATHGTQWGLVARARIRERALRQVIESLEPSATNTGREPS